METSRPEVLESARQAVEDPSAEAVDAVLRDHFSLAASRARKINDSYVALWERLERNATGGKRFRPRLVLAMHHAYDGADLNASACVGAAFELLHTALIVHDDVIDRDFTRRGLPNLSGSYRDIATTAGIPIPTAEHRGMSTAVIAGDLALAAVFQLVERARLAADVRGRVLEYVDEALFASAAGELADVDLSMAPGVPDLDQVVDMARLKTAVYTFETPLQAGAVVAGAPEADVEALGEFGRHIGIAYQAADDLLGLFGDERRTGKSVLGDLREGKSTIPIALAARSDRWPEISSFLGKPDLSHDEAERARELMRSVGADAETRRLAQQHADAARAILETLPPGVGENLDPLVSEALDRDR